MKSLKEQMQSYGAYHTDPRNKLTHFIGVPLVTFALFLFLGWFRFVLTPNLPITVATIFYVVVLFYYLKLDYRIALLQLPFTLVLLWVADWAARLPPGQSLAVFLVTFVLGWILQLLGHAIEGRRPALADNMMQIFNAPLFLTVELLARLGMRRDLYEPVAVDLEPTAPATPSQSPM
jgi:uncharacterized membrane protein YGL010W